ncbi:transcription factor [Teratosphaeriaceae sp. CCFEE 6253]|nr:transcription factor [Teratosphaeriaceae sp. CCFEE 6253]
MCKQRRVKVSPGRRPCAVWCEDYPPSPRPDVLSQGGISRALSPYHSDIDTRLMQHYLSHTGDTYARLPHNVPEQAAVWTSVLPAAAFQVKAASHALMAMSAWCLDSHRDASDRSGPDYRAIAERQYSHALTLLQPILNALDEATAGSALATIMLLGACGMAKMRGRDDLSAISEWLHHIRAFMAVKATLSHLPTAGYGAMGVVMRASIPYDRSEWIEADTTAPPGQSKLFQAMRETWQIALQRISTAIDTTHPPPKPHTTEAYHRALALLHDVCEYLLAHIPWNRFRATFHWAAQLPTLFAQLLTRGDALASVIYAHWLVCILLLRNRWWVGEMGTHGIRRVAAVIRAAGGTLGGLLEWPEEMVRRSVEDQRAGLFALGSVDAL